MSKPILTQVLANSNRLIEYMIKRWTDLQYRVVNIYAIFESKYKNNLLNRYKVMSATSSALVTSLIRLHYILLNHF